MLNMNTAFKIYRNLISCKQNENYDSTHPLHGYVLHGIHFLKWGSALHFLQRANSNVDVSVTEK